MENNVKNLLKLQNWAVIGASNKEERYSYKIIQQLVKNGNNVIPIAVKDTTIQGIKAYKSLLDYEGDIDVVNFVVNPKIGLKVLDAVIEKGIKHIWLQPGSESDELVKKAEENGIDVTKACVLVVLGWKK